MNRRRFLSLGALSAITVAGAAMIPELAQTLDEEKTRRDIAARTLPLFDRFRFEQVPDPDRTIVYTDRTVPVATLTVGARTVAFNGPTRRFIEPAATDAVVDSDTWIRIAPQPWQPGLHDDDAWRLWFAQALTDTTPDALAIAMQYVTGVPPVVDHNGVTVAGDAGFGPPLSNGARAERSDFYDYLGINHTFPDGPPGVPDPARYRMVDCSGYLRLVYGYRLGLPLYRTNTKVPGLPRRAYAIATLAPAVTVLTSERNPPARTDLTRLQPGDLLFFALDADPTFLSHSGIYLGLDDKNRPRFVSSRATINGPTMGDVGGDSLLDGRGFLAEKFRRAVRL